MRESIQKTILLYFTIFFLGSGNSFGGNCPTPVISVGGNNMLCSGDSVQLTASQGQTYLWSSGQVSRSIFVKNSGTYSVVVSDINGCTAASAPVNITVLSPPDAALQDTIDNFMNCTYNLGASNFNLTVENISQTKATNTKYTIEWGDGQASIFGANFSAATHTYLLPGSFNLKLTVTNAAGCKSTKSYTVYNGSNPSFGVASQGNTNDCAPATFTFDIINTQGNTPSTVYTFQFDDGTPAITYTHSNLPKTLTHTFTKGAWGKPGNAFTLTAYATNPCGTTPATVGGIRISSTPVADFKMEPDSISCVNMPVKLTDLTDGGFNANASGTATASYTRKWEILPATGWTYINGTNNTSSQPILNFSATGVYTIKLLATPRGAGAKCQADSISKNIVIQGLPKAAFTLNQPAGNCAPAVVSVKNNSTGDNLTYNWEVTPKTGFTFSAQTDSVSVQPQFTFTKPGSYLIKLTATNSCGQTSTSDSTIVIKGVPEVKLATDQQYCISQTVAFSAQNLAHKPEVKDNGSPVLEYNWQVINASGATFVNGTSTASQFPVINFSTAGTYQVVFKARNACGFSQPDTQQVIINPAPKVIVHSSVKAICEGQGSTTLTASGANSYRWFPAIGLSATTGASIQANPTSTTVYSVIGTNSLTGCVDTTQFTVVVKPAIPLTINATKTRICEGQQTTTLSASGADLFSWSPAIGLNVTSGNTVIANPTVTTTYTITATDTLAGCTAVKTIRIEVVPLPVVNAGADSTICLNASGLQLNGKPSGGNWSGMNVSGSGLFLPATNGVYNLTYTFTNANGCISASSRKITVVSMPQVFAGNDTVFCALPAGIFLKGLPQGGRWSGNALVKANGEFTANVPGTYTLTYTYGNGNCEVSDQKIITVNPIPAAPTFAPVAICPGETATINLQGTATRYEWYDATTGGNLITSGKTFTTPVLQNSVTYYVVAYNAAGCAANQRLAVPVTVHPIVAAPVSADVTICGPGKAVLTASGSAPTFKWYDTASNGNLLFTGATFQPTVANTTNYYVEAVSATGCVSFSRTKATVFVQPIIANNSISGSQTICENSIPGVLTGSTPTGGNNTFKFVWESSTDNLNFLPVSGIATPNLQPSALTQTTWFRRIATSGVCENVSLAVKITVIPKPQAPVVQNVTVCAGAAASINLPVANGIQYQWFTTTTGGQPLFTGNGFTTPVLQATTEYFVQTINTNNCESATRTRVLVTVLPAIANNFISVDQTICAGETPAALTGSNPNGGNGNYTFIWQFSTDNVNWNVASGTNNGLNYTPAVLTQTTWFRRLVTSGPCSQNLSAAVQITVLPGITNNTINSTSVNVCFGNTPATITGNKPNGGNGNYTYQWQSSTTNATTGFTSVGSNGQNQNFTSGALSQTTWFRRVAFSGNCSQVSAAVKIEVIPTIANNTISASQTIYANSIPAVLNGSVPTGGTGNYEFEWEMSTTSSSAGFQKIANEINSNYAAGTLTQTTWFRRNVISGDCNLTSNVVQITVVPEIANNLVQADQTICQNNQPNKLKGSLPVGGTGNFTYQWEMSITSATSGFSLANGVNNLADYQPGFLAQTTWFRRKVSSGAFASESNIVKITVNPEIDNNLVSSDQTICAGSTPAMLEGSLPIGGSESFKYLWETSTTGATTGFVTASGINNQVDYTPAVLQKTTWFRRRVSAGHCSDNVSPAVKVTVNIVPSPPSLNPIYTCANEETTIVIPGGNSLIGDKDYEWYENATGGQMINSGTTFTTPALTQSKIYYVQTAQNGCVSVRTAIEVRVRENTADAGEDVAVIKDRSTTLQAKGGVSYKWFPAEGLSNPAIANPIATPLKTTTYKVEVVSEAGCVSYDEVTVTVLPKIAIPNTFTPNNDGINDVWEIKGLAEYKNCQVDIFNRWGQKIYSSTGYNKPFEGIAQTGEELPIATYYYIIQLKKDEAPLSGSVTIIR